MVNNNYIDFSFVLYFCIMDFTCPNYLKPPRNVEVYAFEIFPPCCRLHHEPTAALPRAGS